MFWKKSEKLHTPDNSMLTRREVLAELGRVGVGKLSELKRDCREFEQYMLVNYDYGMTKKEEIPRRRGQGVASDGDNFNFVKP